MNRNKYEVLVARRVECAKPKTPIEWREYVNMVLGVMGRRARWIDIAKQYNYEAVEFWEPDGTKELCRVR